jgi:transcriptional regulator with XRE-family HTH domain
MATFVELARRAIGLQLRDRRIALDLSQDDVASSVGMNRSNLSRLENGQQRCSLETYERLAAALDCDFVLATWLIPKRK